MCIRDRCGVGSSDLSFGSGHPYNWKHTGGKHRRKKTNELWFEDGAEISSFAAGGQGLGLFLPRETGYSGESIAGEGQKAGKVCPHMSWEWYLKLWVLHIWWDRWSRTYSESSRTPEHLLFAKSDLGTFMSQMPQPQQCHRAPVFVEKRQCLKVLSVLVKWKNVLTRANILRFEVMKFFKSQSWHRLKLLGASPWFQMKRGGWGKHLDYIKVIFVHDDVSVLFNRKNLEMK